MEKELNVYLKFKNLYNLRASVSNTGLYFRARKFADGRAMESVTPCGN
jgi:hypothetical protein